MPSNEEMEVALNHSMADLSQLCNAYQEDQYPAFDPDDPVAATIHALVGVIVTATTHAVTMIADRDYLQAKQPQVGHKSFISTKGTPKE